MRTVVQGVLFDFEKINLRANRLVDCSAPDRLNGCLLSEARAAEATSLAFLSPVVSMYIVSTGSMKCGPFAGLISRVL